MGRMTQTHSVFDVKVKTSRPVLPPARDRGQVARFRAMMSNRGTDRGRAGCPALAHAWQDIRWPVCAKAADATEPCGRQVDRTPFSTKMRTATGGKRGCSTAASAI